MTHAPHLTRRILLRRAFAAGIGLALGPSLVSCVALPGDLDPESPGTAADPAAGTGATGSVPRELRPIPTEFRSPSDRPGTLVELGYDTYESLGYEDGAERLTKRAIVYLPFGYSENERYDVFYLMHGGWSDETTTLGVPGAPSEFTHVLDHAIAAGELRPLIIVCPTYNNTSGEDSSDFGLALTLTRNYHRELVGDLMPAVEGRFRTYAEDTTPEGLAAARDHRGFGGFSMGAVTTWRTFQYALDHFSAFLPMSCGTSLDMEQIMSAAAGRDPADYFVWIITGSADFARSNDVARAEILRASPYFTDSDAGPGGNFAFRMKDGYRHDEVAASEYTYNGLRWFWGTP